MTGSKQLAALVDRILSESVSLTGETEQGKVMYFAMSAALRDRLVAEMSRTGLIFNCPRLDAGRCMYFATPEQLENVKKS